MVDNKDENKDGQKTGAFRNLLNTGQLTRFTVYLLAMVPAVILIIFGLLSIIGILPQLIIPLEDGSFIFGTGSDYFIIAILIMTGVLGIYEFFNLRRIRKIDERFPDFIRDLAESRRAGMTFTKSIMYASKGKYGVLTEEIQKIARQISWGSSVEKALDAFANRVNTKLIKRTISVIIEASNSGGNVADVLDAASKDSREIKLIESERRANMLSYVAIIYVGLFVFILIIFVLTKSLLPNMLGSEASETGKKLATVSIGGGGGITQKAVTELFYYACLIQGGMMGIVTGIFEEGNVKSGIKHSFIMMLITFIIFKVLITGI
jgi:flagellar protein FlaJ